MTARNVAILVGVDRFGDTAFTPLRFCQNDVDGMARVLSNPELCGFEIVELRNKSRDEILESLDRTVQSLTPGDKLLFYFAGHGRRSPQSGRLYLVATNTKSDALRATGILIDDALDIIRESRCANRALVLDCCHSGAIGQAFRGGDLASGLSDLARNSGTYILTASTAIELAAERESAATADGSSGNGIFTRYFIEAIESGDASSEDSDAVTIDAVYDYVQQRLSVHASQIPQRFVIGGAGNFVIGRSAAAHWERRRSELLVRFRELIDQNIISDADYIAATRLFRTSWSALTPDQKLRARTGFDVLDGKTSVSQFFSGLGKPNTAPATSWKAEFVKRTRSHFLIRFWCLDEVHHLELAASYSRVSETIFLDGAAIDTFWTTGRKFVAFTLGTHSNRFHLQFQCNQFQRIWKIEFRVDSNIILSSDDRPNRALSAFLLVGLAAAGGYFGYSLDVSWVPAAAGLIAALGLLKIFLGWRSEQGRKS